MEQSAQDHPRKFRSSCGICHTEFRVTIRTGYSTFHRIACPSCGRILFFDNSHGQLRTLAEGSRIEPASGPGTGRESEKPEQSGGTEEPPEPMKDYSLRKTGSFSRPTGKKKNLSRSNRRSFGEFFSDWIPDWKLPRFSVLLVLLGALVVLAPLGGFTLVQLYAWATEGSMGHYALRMEPVRENRIVDRNGKLIAELFSRKTGDLKPDQLPGSLKEKLIFVEDGNFYTHGGIDWFSMIRAVFANLVNVSYSQGASTLTQQLARILLNRREKTIFRKLHEASLAYYLEDHYSKERILTAYMNLVYLGHGAIGMENAAKFYFNKKIQDLDFVEELVLVCLPSAPERYSPLKNPKLLEKKMDAVYERMADSDWKVPSRKDYDREKYNLFRSMNRSPGESVFGSRVDHAPFVSEYIRQKIGVLLGSDYEFGAGLTVETTLDRKFQEAAAEESVAFIREVAPRYRAVRYEKGKRVRGEDAGDRLKDFYEDAGPALLAFGYPDQGGVEPILQAASVGIDPGTGEVLFLQGGTEFSSRNQLNRVVDMRRQTGSAIKPVIYAAGIASGVITAASNLDDTPLYVSETPQSPDDPGYWLPSNITGVYEGKMPVREALMKSKNVPAIRLAKEIGMERLSSQFRKFFFTTDDEFDRRFRPDFTIAIGSLEMSPLDMAVAFGAFGNNGVIRRPYLIRRILGPDGKVLFNGVERDEFQMRSPLERKVMSGDVAEVMASLMRDSGKYGGVGRGGFSSPDLLGKTGTTNDNRDAWFVGVLPGVAAAVWVGYDEPTYSMPGGTGSHLAGPLFGRIFSRAYEQGNRNFEFDPHAVTREICAGCDGKLAGPYCPEKKTEIFALNRVPEEVCTDYDPDTKNNPGEVWNLNRDSDFQ